MSKTLISIKIELTTFKTQEEAKIYFDKYVKPTIEKRTSGFRKRVCNDDGFYYHLVKGVLKARSCNEIDKCYMARNANINILNRYRLVPCYEDVKDATTIEWRLYHCVFI